MAQTGLQDLLHFASLGSLGKGEQPNIEGRVVKISSGQYAVAGLNYELLAQDVSTFLGLVMYNPDSNVGLIAHIPKCQIIGDYEINRFVSEVSYVLRRKTGSDDMNGFKCAVIGISCFNFDWFTEEVIAKYKEVHSKEAANVTQRLREEGFTVFDIPDLVAGEYISRDLRLNIESGELTVIGARNGETVERATVYMGLGNIRHC